MKNLLLSVAFVTLGFSPVLADVKVTEEKDCIRVTVDGELFTEWRHSDWKAPYLYPVIGPNGVNITRHYPMIEGQPGEDDDHPHHRSIRFSHRGVNGFSFWAPDSKEGGKQAEIALDKIVKLTSGESGEAVLVNRWMGDGKLVLTETVRLAFHPLPDRQMLLDYDVTLDANGGEDVLFVDQKDGGLMVRVAASMKVSDRKGNEGKGTILNSHGDKNDEAWGKRADWADYFGPDPSGKTVGIAIFDHPSNLRYPTHWHARTYGLITANRWGAGHFEQANGAKKGDGDYTLPKGESLTLRHRLYIHHGDPESAGVAEQYKDYSGSGTKTAATE